MKTKKVIPSTFGYLQEPLCSILLQSLAPKKLAYSPAFWPLSAALPSHPGAVPKSRYQQRFPVIDGKLLIRRSNNLNSHLVSRIIRKRELKSIFHLVVFLFLFFFEKLERVKRALDFEQKRSGFKSSLCHLKT